MINGLNCYRFILKTLSFSIIFLFLFSVTNCGFGFYEEKNNAFVFSENQENNSSNNTNPDGNGSNPDGNGSNPDGNGSNPDGNGSNPDGKGSNPDGNGTNNNSKGELNLTSELNVSLSPDVIKIDWTAAPDAEYYDVLIIKPDYTAEVLASGLTDTKLVKHVSKLWELKDTEVLLNVCPASGDCNLVRATTHYSENLVEAIGYFKTPTNQVSASFPAHLVISENGETIAAVQAKDNAAQLSTGFRDGVVHVYKDMANELGQWEFYSSVRPHNSNIQHYPTGFGLKGIDLSNDGKLLVVSHHMEAGATPKRDGWGYFPSTGIFNPSQFNNSKYQWTAFEGVGAVYVFYRAVADISAVPDLRRFNQVLYIKPPTYLKADNHLEYDSESIAINFGWDVAISGNGNIIAISAIYEDSDASGTDINATNKNMKDSGAVYIYEKPVDGNIEDLRFHSILKSPDLMAYGQFGNSVYLDDSGTRLLVNSSTPKNFYLFQYNEASDTWQKELTLSNTSFAKISGDGKTIVYLVVGASSLDIIRRDSANTWRPFHKIYDSPAFINSFDISADGNSIIVGKPADSTSAVGVTTYDPNSDDFSIDSAGAARIYEYDLAKNEFVEKAYLKATNTGEGDIFGSEVAISGDGGSVVVGAPAERSNGFGINHPNQADNSSHGSGAFYLY